MQRERINRNECKPAAGLSSIDQGRVSFLAARAIRKPYRGSYTIGASGIAGTSPSAARQKLGSFFIQACAPIGK
jgi:hypothetical protein